MGDEIRPDKLSRNLARSMRRSGCYRVEMGVETGDPGIFETVGKKTSRLSLVKRGFENARNAGIITFAELMVGLPGESWESITKTRIFLDKLRPDIIQVSIATPYPGTKFHEEAIKNNWLISDQLEHLDAYTPVLEYPDFSASDIAKAKTLLTNWSRANSLIRAIQSHVKQRNLFQASLNMLRFGLGVRKYYPRIVDLLRK